jgi:beta-barrel assembly-enhancing protease
MPHKRFYLMLALMIGCGAAVSMGRLDSDVSLESTRAIWADVLHDVDAVGLQATRVSPQKEMELGNELAQQIAREGGEDPEAVKYVAAVAESLLPNVNRTAMRYHFHVIRSTQINAFAVPGGQIYVFTGLLDFLQSEAELASILGHEISHVDLRHAIERYQYELALKKGGAQDAGPIARFAHELVAIGYTQDQELEADASGERLAIEAGYDPDAARSLFTRMQAKFGESTRSPAATPLGEAGGAIVDVIGSYFQTHPPSRTRARYLADMVARNHRELGGRVVYKGVENYRKRTPRSALDLDSEKRIY